MTTHALSGRPAACATASARFLSISKITQRVKITPDIRKDVVGAQHAWWFPEEAAPDYGWQKSNLNLLYGNMAYDPDIGAEPLRGVLCKIYK